MRGITRYSGKGQVVSIIVCQSTQSGVRLSLTILTMSVLPNMRGRVERLKDRIAEAERMPQFIKGVTGRYLEFFMGFLDDMMYLVPELRG